MKKAFELSESHQERHDTKGKMVDMYLFSSDHQLFSGPVLAER